LPTLGGFSPESGFTLWLLTLPQIPAPTSKIVGAYTATHRIKPQKTSNEKTHQKRHYVASLGEFETRERQRFLQKSQIRGKKLATEDFYGKIGEEISSNVKVDVQWRLFALVHNIGKIHTFGALQ
jgi:hypothetical protein